MGGRTGSLTGTATEKGFAFDLQRFATFYAVGGASDNADVSLTDNMFESIDNWNSNTYYLKITTDDNGKITDITVAQGTGSANMPNFSIPYVGRITGVHAQYKAFGIMRMYRLRLADAGGVTVDTLVCSDDSDNTDTFTLADDKTLTVGCMTGPGPEAPIAYTQYKAKGTTIFKVMGLGEGKIDAVLTSGGVDADATAGPINVNVSADGNAFTQTITLNKGKAIIGTTGMTALSDGGEVGSLSKAYTIKTVDLKYTPKPVGSSETETWGSVKVDNVTYKSGDTAGGKLTIAYDGEYQYVTSGTIYMDAKYSQIFKVGGNHIKVTTTSTS